MRSAGTGKLGIIIKKDGTEICRKSVRLVLRPITQFYQVFQVASAGQNSTDVSQKANDTFNMTMMYKGVDHRVPLHIVGWSWQGAASYDGIDWNLTSGSTNVIINTPTENYPQWGNILKKDMTIQ